MYGKNTDLALNGYKYSIYTLEEDFPKHLEFEVRHPICRRHRSLSVLLKVETHLESERSRIMNSIHEVPTQTNRRLDESCSVVPDTQCDTPEFQVRAKKKRVLALHRRDDSLRVAVRVASP